MESPRQADLGQRYLEFLDLPATNPRGKVWKPFQGFQIDDCLTLLPDNRVRRVGEGELRSPEPRRRG